MTAPEPVTVPEPAVTGGSAAGDDPVTGGPPASGRTSRWRRWRPAITVAWVVVVAVAAAAVAGREWERISDRVSDLSPALVLAGAVATLAAKLALGENARVAAGRHGIDLTWAQATRLYNLSQLGKYVPGSVWQFVGRGVSYRERGARLGDIRDALLTESLWVIGGAAVVGLALGGTAVLPAVASAVDGRTGVWLVAGTAVVVVAVLTVVAVRGRRARARALEYTRRAVPTPRAVLTQALVWGLLGTGFWCFCLAADVSVSWPYAVGLFSAAYALGFVVLLAPAGLGVRDAVLVAGLLPVTGAETGLLVAVVARLVYLLVELVLVAAGELIQAVGTRGSRG